MPRPPARYPFMTLDDDFVPRLAEIVRFEIGQGITAGILGSSRGTGKMLTDIARIIQAGLAPNERQAAHERLARRAQRAVLNSYAQTVTAQKKVPSYRLGDRYAGGKLRAALGSRRMWDADADGINFIHTDFLDQEAAHWARLNAGALGKGTGSRERFQVRFSGLVVASLGLDMDPSPAFRIPRGYWWDGSQPVKPGSTPAEFHLAGTGPRRGTQRVMDTNERRRVPFQKPRVSGGIEARRFLDTGVRVLANELGPTYDRLYKDLFTKKIGTVRPSKIRATVGRQRIQLSL